MPIDTGGLSNDDLKGLDLGIPMLPIPIIKAEEGLGALQDLTKARNAASAAAAEAINKNTSLQESFVRQNDDLTTDTLDAYSKLQKIQQLGGVNPVTKFLGLFNHDYNMGFQLNRIDTNAIKGKQAADKTKTQIEINNQIPALRQAEVEGAKNQADLQQRSLEIVGKYAEIDNKIVENKISVARLMMDMDKDKRDKVNFMLKGMSLQQARAELAKAKKDPKADWAGLEGLLEDRIHTEEAGDVALQQARTNLKSSNLELQDKSFRNLMQYVPVDAGNLMLQKATATGQPVVNFDGVGIPVNIFSEGLKKNQEIATATTATAMAMRTDTMNSDLETLNHSLSGMAMLDQRALRQYQFLQNARANFDPQNPATYGPMRAAIDMSMKKRDEIAKSVASTYTSKDAQAAVERAATTGQMDIPGATSIVSDVMDKPGVSSSAKHADAYDILRMDLAEQIGKQNPEAPKFGSGSSQQGNAILAWAMQKGDRIKIPELKDMLLANPGTKEKVRASIEGDYTQEFIQGALNDLAKPGAAGPVFAELKHNFQQIAFNKNGEFSREQLQTFLENQSALGQYKTDFNQVFIDAVTKRAVTSAQQFDPSNTIHDKALETAIYGREAAPLVGRDLVRQMRDNASVVRQEKQRQLEADKAGRPQAKAVNDVASTMAQYGATPTAEQMEGAAQAAPSATGTGRSADYMRKLYGGQ